MKKILLSILLIFMAVGMVGCSEEDINYIDIEATDVDMSVYDGMNSLNHHFKSITPTELLRVYNEGGSGIFYIGYSGCHNCQAAVKYIEEAAANNDVTVYYMDCYNPYDPLSEHVDEFIETFKDVLREDEEGNKTIYTPQVMTFVNGKVADSIIALPEGDSETIVNTYSSIMERFKPAE